MERRPTRASAVAAKTMYGSRVTPKIAGIESTAKITSLVSMTTSTASIGVAYQRPEERPAVRPVGLRGVGLADEQVRALEVLGRRHVPAQEPQDGVVLRLRLAVAAQHADPAPQQQRAEDVDDPLEALEHLRPRGDERAAQDQRAEDPVEEDAVLVGRRDAERAEDQRPDEDVVERERVLEQVAGVVLLRDVGAFACPQDGAEPEPDRGEPRRRPRRVADRDLVRAAVQHEQVEEEEHHDPADQRRPGGQRDVHAGVVDVVN